MSLVRIDRISGRSVIFAKKRDNRPSDTWNEDFFAKKEDKEDYKDYCPFCKGNEHYTPSEGYCFPNEEKWQVRIVENKYPIIEDEESSEKISEYSYLSNGEHYVISESPLHSDNYFTLQKKDFESIFVFVQDFYKKLLKKEGINYVCYFKNYQMLAGASMSHPHSQIMSMNVAPNNVLDEMIGAEKYYKEKGVCPYCEEIKEQIEQGDRTIYQNEAFIVIEPYAARYKYETWILPKSHISAFENESEDGLLLLADAAKNAFEMMNVALGDFPFNFYLHSSPKKNLKNNRGITPDRKYYHYHFEIVPRLSGGAGFEICSGIAVNSVIPEDAAREILEKNNR